MGASVLGISKNGMISKPSNFKILNLKKKIKYKKIDIRNYNLKKQINLFKPDFIFHLAAEAIVKRSYNNQNIPGRLTLLEHFLNLLDILKEYKRKVIAVIITSDKSL